jgi:hypothetical protein
MAAGGLLMADRDVSFARCALFSRPRSGCTPSAGQDGALLYPGPLCGGESGSAGRAAGIGMDADAFSPGQDALSKSPAPAHGLAAQDGRQAPSGVAFSFGYFSLGHAREK